LFLSDDKKMVLMVVRNTCCNKHASKGLIVKYKKSLLKNRRDLNNKYVTEIE
jgi:hypothetical protein